MKTHNFTITVSVPKNVKVEEIQEVLNAAFDEPPKDWGDWTVGAFLPAKKAKRDTKKQAANNLADSAQHVIDNWSEGDLAEAVNGLENALQEFRG